MMGSQEPPVPWMCVAPMTAATVVLRSHRGSHEDTPYVASCIAEFALERPTWEVVETGKITDSKALCAAQWLIAHNLRPISITDTNPNPIMDCMAHRGFLSVLQFLHQECGTLLTTGCLTNATWQGHFDVVKYICTAPTVRTHGLAASIWNASRFDVEFHPLEDIASEALNDAARFGHTEIFKYLCEAAGACLSFDAMENALLKGRLDIVEYMWVQNSDFQNEVKDQLLTRAREVPKEAFGYPQIVRWLHENGVLCHTVHAINNAASQGSLESVQYLHELERGVEKVTTDAMDDAASMGHLDVVRFLHEHRSEGCTTKALDGAAMNGHLDVVKYLHEKCNARCTVAAMTEAAAKGHLDIVMYFHDNRSDGCTTDAMDTASRNGHTSVVKYLHLNRTEGCTRGALTGAISNGHFELVKFLLENRTEGADIERARVPCIQSGNVDVIKCLHEKELLQLTPDDLIHCLHLDVVQYVYDACIAKATDEVRASVFSKVLPKMAKAGHLDQIQFLDSQRHPGEIFCSSAMDAAAEVGHIDIVKYLHHQTHHVGCTTEAMDSAARHGNFVLVRLLHRLRSEGCTTAAMDDAATNGHLDVVQFLHENRSEGCTTEAMDGAAENGLWDVVLYLHRHRHEGCTTAAIESAARCNSLEMVKFFYEDVGVGCLQDALNAAEELNHCQDDLREYLEENAHSCQCKACARG